MRKRKWMILVLFCSCCLSKGRNAPDTTDTYELWEYEMSLFSSEEPDDKVLELMGDSPETVVSNGWVVIGGERIQPPYRIMRNANGIKINGKLIGFRNPVPTHRLRLVPPPVPADFPTNSLDLFETDQGQSYWRACEEYLFTVTTNDYCLADDMLPLILALPSVARAWTEEPFPGCGPADKRLCVEWRSDTNHVEQIDVFQATFLRWGRREDTLRWYNNCLDVIVGSLREGGLVLSVPECLGARIHKIQRRTPAEGESFLSAMRDMADGAVPTSGLPAALRAICLSDSLEPMFAEHLSSYSSQGE